MICEHMWLEPIASEVLEDQKNFIKSKYLLGCEGIEDTTVHISEE